MVPPARSTLVGAEDSMIIDQIGLKYGGEKFNRLVMLAYFVPNG